MQSHYEATWSPLSGVTCNLSCRYGLAYLLVAYNCNVSCIAGLVATRLSYSRSMHDQNESKMSCSHSSWYLILKKDFLHTLS